LVVEDIQKKFYKTRTNGKLFAFDQKDALADALPDEDTYQ
jgi:hypothetical protein